MQGLRLFHPAGLERLTVVTMDDPGQPGPGQIRVRIEASSLNYHDLAVALGWLPTQDGRIPLSDGAGTVEAVGEGVTEFVVGDRVVSCFYPFWLDGGPTVGDFSTTPGDGFDGYAREVVVVPATHFTLAPKGYSALEAATLTTAGVTAWRALVVNGPLKPGDVVVTLGTGGVSIFALQLAKAAGATVIVTSSSDEKLEHARALGADHLINYRRTEQWGKAIQDITHGQGADHVLEIGGPGTLPQSIEACRIGGHISLIGILTGFDGKIPTMLMMCKQQRLQGLIVGSRQHQRDFVRALDGMAFRPVIDRVYPLAETAEAFRYQQAAQHFGKIALTV